MLKTVKVSDKGQIALPRSVQVSFGINKGDELVMVNVGNKLVLEKLDSVKKKIEDDFSDIAYFNSKSLDEVWNNEEDEVWGEYLK